MADKVPTNKSGTDFDTTNVLNTGYFSVNNFKVKYLNGNALSNLNQTVSPDEVYSKTNATGTITLGQASFLSGNHTVDYTQVGSDTVKTGYWTSGGSWSNSIYFPTKVTNNDNSIAYQTNNVDIYTNLIGFQIKPEYEAFSPAVIDTVQWYAWDDQNNKYFTISGGSNNVENARVVKAPIKKFGITISTTDDNTANVNSTYPEISFLLHCYAYWNGRFTYDSSYDACLFDCSDQEIQYYLTDTTEDQYYKSPAYGKRNKGMGIKIATNTVLSTVDLTGYYASSNNKFYNKIPKAITCKITKHTGWENLVVTSNKASGNDRKVKIKNPNNIAVYAYYSRYKMPLDYIPTETGGEKSRIGGWFVDNSKDTDSQYQFKSIGWIDAGATSDEIEILDIDGLNDVRIAFYFIVAYPGQPRRMVYTTVKDNTTATNLVHGEWEF